MEHQLHVQHCGPGHKTKMGPDLMGSLSRDGYKPAITRSCDRSFKIGVMGVQARNCHPDSGSPGKGFWGVRPEDEEEKEVSRGKESLRKRGCPVQRLGEQTMVCLLALCRDLRQRFRERGSGDIRRGAGPER